SSEGEQQRKGQGAGVALRSNGARHPLLGARLDLAVPTWLKTLPPQELAFLHDHRVKGAVVFPGTGFSEMALASLSDPDRTTGPGDAPRAGPAEGERFVLNDVEIG